MLQSGFLRFDNLKICVSQIQILRVKDLRNAGRNATLLNNIYRVQ